MSTAGVPSGSSRKAAPSGGPQVDAIATAFPAIDPEVTVFGSRILVQLRQPKLMSAGGIVLPGATRDSEKWNTQVGVVRAIGPVAFSNRTTMVKWPEGDWCAAGDFVRVPKYGGDRFEVPLPDGEKALFAIFNDLDILAKITGDPLKIIAFI